MKTNRQLDAIVEAMREVFEVIENEEIKKINIALLGGRVEFGANDELLDKMTTNVQKIVDVDTKNLRDKIQKGGSLLAEKARENYQKQKAKINKLARTQDLYKAIYEQTQKNIRDGIRIAYKNGRTIGYKEYMEMNVRTTLQNEIVDNGLKVGAVSKTVFYVCNSFNDCADDHADYQGKVYYDERYISWGFEEEQEEAIKEHILKNKLMAMQDVIDEKPYLTRRPNCRHKLYPISLKQALNLSPNQLLDKFNIKRGTYKKSDYKQTQEQRYNERQIRYYKDKANQNEELYRLNPNNEKFIIQAQKDRVTMRKWQTRQRELIKKFPHLERDYRRETRDKIVQDLGARYNS